MRTYPSISTKQSTPTQQITARKLTDHLIAFGGAQFAIDFMRHFTGLVLPVPKRDVVERFADEFHIVRKIKADPSTENVRAVAGFLGISQRDAAKRFADRVGVGVSELRENKNRLPVVHRSRVRPMRIHGPRRIRDYPGQMQLFSV